MAGIVNILLWASSVWYIKHGINDTAIVLAISATLQAFGVGKACLWNYHWGHMFERYMYGVILWARVLYEEIYSVLNMSAFDFGGFCMLIIIRSRWNYPIWHSRVKVKKNTQQIRNKLALLQLRILLQPPLPPLDSPPDKQSHIRNNGPRHSTQRPAPLNPLRNLPPSLRSRQHSPSKITLRIRSRGIRIRGSRRIRSWRGRSQHTLNPLETGIVREDCALRDSVHNLRVESLVLGSRNDWFSQIERNLYRHKAVAWVGLGYWVWAGEGRRHSPGYESPGPD